MPIKGQILILLLTYFSQIQFTLCQYVIQDVHFENYQNQALFDISLNKWKSMDPTPDSQPLYDRCSATLLYLVIIAQQSNKLQWTTPTPKIAPSQAPQAFYSMSLEADFLFVFSNGYRPLAKLTLHLNNISIDIYDTSSSWNTSYENGFGNLCYGSGDNFYTMSYQTIYRTNSPVLIELQSQGIDALNGMFSIKNLIIRYAYCHQSCSACSGPAFDQCTQCPDGSELDHGKCLCKDITICRCPLDICGYIYNGQSRDITQGLTYGRFGFDQFPSVTSTQVPYQLDQCLQFSLQSAYQLPLASLLQLQTYMIVVTYKIIITNPQGNFQLQFEYGDNTNISIIAYSNSNYLYSNVYQYTTDRNIGFNQDAISVSIIFNLIGSSQNLKIQGNFLGSRITWLLCQISIREIACQANCKLCLTHDLCSSCLPSFYLFNGTCLDQCSGGYIGFANKVCGLNTGTYLLSYYSLISYMFFDFNTTSQEAQDAFQIMDCSSYINAAHSVMSNDGSHARRVYGGMLTFGNILMTKHIDLSVPNYNPNHGAIIQFTFYHGDLYDSDINGYICFSTPCDINNYIQIDNGSLIQPETVSNIIGDTMSETISKHQLIVPSKIQSNLYIEILCSTSLPINQAFCAVSDFMIILLECQDRCNDCFDEYSCNDPFPPCLPGQQLTLNRQECMDISIIGCISSKDSICQACDTNFSLINFSCQCNYGYYLNSTYCNQCNEQCTTCQGPLASDCTTCKDGELLIDGKCITCQTGSDTGVCYQCLTGQLFILMNCFQPINFIQGDNLMHQSALLGFYNLNIYMTQTQIYQNQFCGNAQIEGNEQCDDGNLILFDGCDIDCKFQCHQACLTCMNGYCTECSHGWQVDNGLCSVIFNDGYIILGYEECDDGNTIEYDGCNNGQNQCDKYCQTCSSGRCQNCLIGAQFNSQYICQSVCGDGIVFGNEQCDDRNDIQYDGCYNCLYQCQTQCDNCQQGVCQICSGGYLYNQHCYDCILPCLTCDRFQCLTCQTGWYPIDNYCQTQCGDGIVAGTEECDLSINCFNCIYVIPPNCISIVQGICKLCDAGYQLNSLQNCAAICGDFIIQSGEQCDDGNTRNFDGCSSECQNEPAQTFDVPYMELTQLFSDKPNIQLVEIQFNEQLYYKINLSTQQIFNITLTNTSEYDIQINQINRYFTYQSIITFKQTSTQPILFVQLLCNLTNQNNMPLQETQKILIMDSQYYYSQAELENFTTISDILKYFIYIILAFCFITYLLGKQEVFYNFLDVLQRLSYLQYINIRFPYSLQYLFSLFDDVSLNYCFDNIGISIQKIQFPYYQSFGKFEDDYNALLLANIFSTFLLVSLLLLIYIIGSMLYSTILYGFSEKLSQIDQINKIQVYCMQSLWSTMRQIRQINFREILNSSCYDNTISVLLQLNAIYFNNDIYNVISLVFMVIIGIYLHYDFIRVWQQLTLIYNQSLRNSMKINDKYTWSCHYLAIFYLKKIAFCIILVCIQSAPILQILFFMILSLINLVLVYNLKPFKDKYEYSKLIIEESIILLIYISLIAQIEDVSPFTIEQKNYFAWIDISLLVTCMAVLVLIDIYCLIFIEFQESFKQLLNKLLQKLQLRRREQKRRNFDL